MDPAIVAAKLANKAERSAAEPVERRAGTKGNAGQQSTHRTQRRASVSQALERIRKVARERKKERFTALFHHINTAALRGRVLRTLAERSPWRGRLTWRAYEADLERNVEDLHERVQRGAYRALPSRRVYIPKPDGRQRPLAVAALEDKIVQRAVATLLNAIYEEDFLGVGAETRVNTTAAGDQFSPSITALSDGGYVVAWSSGTAIYAQRYDGGGNTVGAATQVNATKRDGLARTKAHGAPATIALKKERPLRRAVFADV